MGGNLEPTSGGKLDLQKFLKLVEGSEILCDISGLK